jgi:hypothetical protein
LRVRDQGIGIETNKDAKGLGESLSKSLGKVQIESPKYTARGLLEP